MKASYHLIIEGKVQGVYYRNWMKSEAQKFGIVGWVKNLENGNVEAVIQGLEEDISRLMISCHQGPPAANVLNVKKESAKTAEFSEFEVRR